MTINNIQLAYNKLYFLVDFIKKFLFVVIHKKLGLNE
jgi:hypothetical protein